jgi:hypothetical protein
MGSDGTSTFIGGVWRSDAAGEIKPVHSPIDGSTIRAMNWTGRVGGRHALTAMCDPRRRPFR